MVKYLSGQNISVCDLEGGVNVESDCEVSSPGARGGTVKTTIDKEGKTRAVLITGSFAAYVKFNPSLFFEKVTSSLAGNLSSSTVAQTRSYSLPSNRKASTLARITSAKRQWRRRPLLARRRASTFWLP